MSRTPTSQPAAPAAPVGAGAALSRAASAPEGLPAEMRAVLRCPRTGEELVDGSDEQGRPVLISPGAGLAYLVRDGVPILLVHEAQAIAPA